MKVREIRIKTMRGCRFLRGYIVGALAVHPNHEWYAKGKYWVITHVRSGYRVTRVSTKQEAIQLAEFLGKKSDWSRRRKEIERTTASEIRVLVRLQTASVSTRVVY